MANPDLSSLSDAELFQMAGITPPQKSVDYSSMSDEELARIAGVTLKPKPSPVLAAASGALGGIAGLADLGNALSNLLSGGDISSAIAQKLTGEKVAQDPSTSTAFDFLTGVPDSTKIAPDSYAYKFGSYLPALIGGEASLAKEPLSIISRLFNTAEVSGAGYAGNKVAGPYGELIGSLLPGGVNLGVAKLSSAPEAIEEKLAPLFADSSDLAAQKLAPAKDAIARMALTSENPLYQYQRVAEATQSPYLAQLEQILGKSTPEMNARLVENEAVRQSEQLKLLDSLSSSPKNDTRENAGVLLRSILSPEAADQKTQIGKLFSAIPQDVQTPIDAVRQSFNSDFLKTYEAGGAPSSLGGIFNEINASPGEQLGIKITPNSEEPFSYMHALKERAQNAWLLAKANQDGPATRVSGNLMKQIDEAISQTSNAEAFADANKKYSQFSKTFQQGPVGMALRSMGEGNYQISPSAVPGMVLNGRAENTKALLSALPEDDGVLDQVRGVVRDKILTDTANNDGNLSPGKFRTYLRKNKDGLLAASDKGVPLLDEEHITALDRIAEDLSFMDPSSDKSVKQLANKASKGQPTTAQALLMSDASNAAVDLLPGSKFLKWIGGAVVKGKQDEVNQILSRALTDKEFAKLLASRATLQNVQIASAFLRRISQLGNVLDVSSGQRLSQPLIAASASLSGGGAK